MGEDPDSEISDLFSGIESATGSLEESGPQFTPEDRPRGILSPTDREYLCGLKEYAQPQTDANRRQDIRERVKNGLVDFALLWLFLDRQEREKVFDDLGEEITDEVVESMLAFAHLGLDLDEALLEERIKRGILAAENVDRSFRSSGKATSVDVSIDIEYNPDIDHLYQRFEEGKDLTNAEVGVLVRSGRLETDEIEQLQKHQPDLPGVVLPRRSS